MSGFVMVMAPSPIRLNKDRNTVDLYISFVCWTFSTKNMNPSIIYRETCPARSMSRWALLNKFGLSCTGYETAATGYKPNNPLQSFGWNGESTIFASANGEGSDQKSDRYDIEDITREGSRNIKTQ